MNRGLWVLLALMALPASAQEFEVVGRWCWQPTEQFSFALTIVDGVASHEFGVETIEISALLFEVHDNLTGEVSDTDSVRLRKVSNGWIRNDTGERYAIEPSGYLRMYEGSVLIATALPMSEVRNGCGR